MSEAKQSQSRIFFEKKDEAFIKKENLKIPSTNNQLEGLFSHVKERIKMHLELNQNRKKKAVKFLLKNLGKR